MKVITGSARGRRLLAPSGTDTRPTSAMVKEAIFSIIQFEVEGARMADLFAGSGQMGIEALSRGARSCVFVDHSRESQAVLRKNLAASGLAAQAKAVSADVFSFLQEYGGNPFDIAFLDPPYSAGMLEKALKLVSQKMAARGIILCECGRDQDLPEFAGAFPMKKQYRYGRTKVGLYRHPDTDHATDWEEE